MIIKNFLIRLTSILVGSDKYGNKYYISKKKRDYLGHKSRIVIFKNEEEPSAIPCEWYQWLHFISNTIPYLTNVKKYNWQINRIKNMTGTKLAYSPLKNDKNKLVRMKVSSDYIPWQPKK